jgi:uncharacterized glyoxalase superfamily protein PhnB
MTTTPTSRLLSSVPTFLVSDVGSTTRWYEKHLRFTIYPFPKQEPFVFASMQRDNAEIMLLRQESYVKPVVIRPAGLWDAYIRMENIKEFYETVRREIPIQRELVKQPYGNVEFEVRDPNGYVLTFGE